MLLERRPNFLVMVAHLDRKEELNLFAVFLLFVQDVILWRDVRPKVATRLVTCFYAHT